MKHEDEIIIVNAYLNTDDKVEIAYQCIKRLKKSGIEILLSSHYHIPEKIKNIVDYYLYDKNNVMLTEMGDYYWWKNNNIHFRTRTPFAQHSLAALTSLKNGIYFSKSLGKKNFHHIEYDSILSDVDIEKLKTVKDIVGLKRGYIDTYEMSNLNNGISMLYFYFNIDYFLSFVDIPSDKTDYVNFVRSNVGGVSSEMFLYKKLSDSFDDLIVNKRKGDSISLFSDVDSKIAISHFLSGNEFNHISTITRDHDSDKLYFVFVNKNTELLLIKFGNQKSNICNNCIFFTEISSEKENFEYSVTYEKTNETKTFNLVVKEIIENKKPDEFIKFS